MKDFRERVMKHMAVCHYLLKGSHITQYHQDGKKKKKRKRLPQKHTPHLFIKKPKNIFLLIWGDLKSICSPHPNFVLLFTDKMVAQQ